ncbi:MAG: FtsX-like permease family protein [Clostridia bacterium]|nr:FtsX-like permease family protein [Clostridia bacterium]
MWIIIKFALKNIYEKKLRTLLILLSITISSAVFFASNAISDTVMMMYKDTIIGYYGSTDIVIESTPKSQNPFFTSHSFEPYREKAEFTLGEMRANASYNINKDEKLNIVLRGIDHLDCLRQITPFDIEQEASLFPFEGRKLIISSSAAKKHNLKLGDTLELSVKNVKQKYTICALTSKTGALADMSDGIMALTPIDVTCMANDAKGKISSLFIKLKDPAAKQEMIQQLTKVYNHYNVREPFGPKELKQMTADISITFMLMSIVVFFMSMFIIYSSFKVITVERLPVIGTFRSIGATKKMTNRLLLIESVLYGLIGGILGGGLGIGVLYIFSRMLEKLLAEESRGIQLSSGMSFSPMHFVIAIVMAIVLCFISSLIPIIKVSKIPIKDIVLNTVQKTTKKKRWKLILGIVFLLVSFGSSFRDPSQDGEFIAVFAMIMAPASIVLLIPYITSLFILIFEKLYSVIFGNEGVLAIKNLRGNKGILNNISLLAIGISSLLMINTASYTSAVDIANKYKESYYDLCLSGPPQDKNFYNRLQNAPGISSIYTEFSGFAEGTTDRFRGIHVRGVDKSKFLDYWKLGDKGNSQQVLEELDSGRNLLLTNALKANIGVKEGELLELKTRNGIKTFKVIGFYDKLMGDTYCALASERFVKSDLGVAYFSNLYTKTNVSPDSVKASLVESFGKKQLNAWNTKVETKKEQEENERKSMEQAAMLLRMFSILALVIGTFGVINNLVISFIERKQSLAVLKSIGLSKSQTIKMFFVESSTGGLVGSLTGILGGILMIWILAGASESSSIQYPFDSMIYYVVSGIAVMLIATISPAIRTSKMNIINAIKYE